MMPSSRRLHRLAHNLTEVDFGFFPASLLIPGAPRAQHLFHGFREAVGIAQHEAVEFLLLRFRQIAALQGFKMQADRRHRSFEFVSDSVDETVVLLAPPNLMHQEAGVYDHAGDDESKEDDAEEQQHALPPVENNPSNIERNRQRYEGDAQAEKEYDRSAAARDAHSFRVILPLLANSDSSANRKAPIVDRGQGAGQVDFQSRKVGTLVARRHAFRHPD